MRDRERVEFVDLVTERYSSWCRTAYLLTGNHQTAEDAVHPPWSGPSCTGAESQRTDYPEAYVHRMVVNEVLSLRRRAGNRSGRIWRPPWWR